MEIRTFAVNPDREQIKKTPRVRKLTSHRTASFEDVVAVLNQAYQVSDGEMFRLNKTLGTDITSFDGKTFFQFIRSRGKQYFKPLLSLSSRKRSRTWRPKRS